ncbi:flavin reductase family protein [Streptomyces phaeochromogenes]|uniref:flavin reductase family protein n=1 Tax=Streptomyces phaeochromogenes TaxID=1923 RepID=UPI00386815B7|nr:flavin reductase family protein [Streptomyces phaeochromogenes]
MTALPLPPDVAPAPGPLQDDFHRFMRAWATGIAVVTSRRAQRPVGCTVTAITSVSLRPALLLVSLARDSRTLAAIQEEGAFGVNVLSAEQTGLAGHFATAPGDRFAEVPHHLVEGVPLLNEALATAVCQVEHTITVADHALVLGHPGRYGGIRALAPLIRFGGSNVHLPRN